MPEGKKRSYKYFFWFILVFSGSLFFSCANENCTSIYNNHLLVSFIEADTLVTGEIEFNEIDTLFYSVMAEGNDSVFYTPDTTMTIITLPVNPASDYTSFELVMLDSISYDANNDPIYHENPNPHTISVRYRRTERIISEDCGVEIAYTNLKYEEITFKDTVVVDDKLSRLNNVNIEVYF